jgi:hypothetical protein
MAQTGGSHAFDFLQLPAHARLAGLGGVNVSLADKDINFFQSNPALAGDTLSGFVSAGYQFYLADVGNALFSAAYDFGKAGPLLLGVQHIHYGAIQGFDESGMETLNAAAAETAILVGKNHQVGNFRLGATLKGVFSNIAGYRANALMLDLGGVFKHPEHDLAVGLAIKNIGVILSQYTAGRRPALPFDVQTGVTLKPQYMPLRFSLTAYHLTEGNLLDGSTTGDVERPSRLKNIFCHLDLGAEILVHRNVNLMLGYNYLLRQALKVETGVSPAGFAYGFSVVVKPVEFVFSRSAYVTGNAGYSFTLSTNINQFLKKVQL